MTTTTERPSAAAPTRAETAAAVRAFTGRTPRALRPAWQRRLLAVMGL